MCTKCLSCVRIDNRVYELLIVCTNCLSCVRIVYRVYELFIVCTNCLSCVRIVYRVYELFIVCTNCLSCVRIVYRVYELFIVCTNKRWRSYRRSKEFSSWKLISSQKASIMWYENKVNQAEKGPRGQTMLSKKYGNYWLITFNRITKHDLRIHAYRIHLQRGHFWNWFLKKCRNPRFLANFIISDEAGFAMRST